jgi:hypothetical protein
MTKIHPDKLREIKKLKKTEAVQQLEEVLRKVD